MFFQERRTKNVIRLTSDLAAEQEVNLTPFLAFPGWLPQASEYELTQHRNMDALGTEQAFNDPSRVKLVDGVGYLTFDTSTLTGDTEVCYWPNGFSDPDMNFPVKK